MSKPLPPMFIQTDAEDIKRDVEGSEGTSMEERAAILAALCRLAAEQISAHADPQKALDWEDPVPEESRLLMARLRASVKRRRDV